MDVGATDQQPLKKRKIAKDPERKEGGSWVCRMLGVKDLDTSTLVGRKLFWALEKILRRIAASKSRCLLCDEVGDDAGKIKAADAYQQALYADPNFYTDIVSLIDRLPYSALTSLIQDNLSVMLHLCGIRPSDASHKAASSESPAPEKTSKKLRRPSQTLLEKLSSELRDKIVMKRANRFQPEMALVLLHPNIVRFYLCLITKFKSIRPKAVPALVKLLDSTISRFSPKQDILDIAWLILYPSHLYDLPYEAIKTLNSKLGSFVVRTLLASPEWKLQSGSMPRPYLDVCLGLVQRFVNFPVGGHLMKPLEIVKKFNKFQNLVLPEILSYLSESKDPAFLVQWVRGSVSQVEALIKQSSEKRDYGDAELLLKSFMWTILIRNAKVALFVPETAPESLELANWKSLQEHIKNFYDNLDKNLNRHCLLISSILAWEVDPQFSVHSQFSQVAKRFLNIHNSHQFWLAAMVTLNRLNSSVTMWTFLLNCLQENDQSNNFSGISDPIVLNIVSRFGSSTIPGEMPAIWAIIETILNHCIEDKENRPALRLVTFFVYFAKGFLGPDNPLPKKIFKQFRKIICNVCLLDNPTSQRDIVIKLWFPFAAEQLQIAYMQSVTLPGLNMPTVKNKDQGEFGLASTDENNRFSATILPTKRDKSGIKLVTNMIQFAKTKDGPYQDSILSLLALRKSLGDTVTPRADSEDQNAQVYPPSLTQSDSVWLHNLVDYKYFPQIFKECLQSPARLMWFEKIKRVDLLTHVDFYAKFREFSICALQKILESKQATFTQLLVIHQVLDVIVSDVIKRTEKIRVGTLLPIYLQAVALMHAQVSPETSTKFIDLLDLALKMFNTSSSPKTCEKLLLADTRSSITTIVVNLVPFTPKNQFKKLSAVAAELTSKLNCDAEFVTNLVTQTLNMNCHHLGTYQETLEPADHSWVYDRQEEVHAFIAQFLLQFRIGGEYLWANKAGTKLINKLFRWKEDSPPSTLDLDSDEVRPPPTESLLLAALTKSNNGPTHKKLLIKCVQDQGFYQALQIITAVKALHTARSSELTVDGLNTIASQAINDSCPTTAPLSLPLGVVANARLVPLSALECSLNLFEAVIRENPQCLNKIFNGQDELTSLEALVHDLTKTIMLSAAAIIESRDSDLAHTSLAVINIVMEKWKQLFATSDTDHDQHWERTFRHIQNFIRGIRPFLAVAIKQYSEREFPHPSSAARDIYSALNAIMSLPGRIDLVAATFSRH